MIYLLDTNTYLICIIIAGKMPALQKITILVLLYLAA